MATHTREIPPQAAPGHDTYAIGLTEAVHAAAVDSASRRGVRAIR